MGLWSLVAACGAEVPEGVSETEASLVEGDPIPAHLWGALSGDCDPAELDRVITLEHDVRVGRGRRVHVTERFTPRAWLRWPRRGVLLLPGPVVEGSFYELDVDGYRFASDLAAEGLFTFTIDYEGSGASTYPSSGSTVTHDYLVDEARRVLAALRLSRGIPRMDVLGESNGGAIAAELCADRRRVRSCVLASMLYVEGTPFFTAVFQDPGFLAFLASQPDGYLAVGPELYFNVVARSSPDVTAAILATQPGVYAVAPLLEPATLPFFDPTAARVPGLILMGTEDDIATQADGDLLAADYGSAPGAGGTATLVRLEGAGHIPRVEPPPTADAFRDAVIEFLDP
jgi:pimeloyl-ACP methyl ester carboxylesterase